MQSDARQPDDRQPQAALTPPTSSPVDATVTHRISDQPAQIEPDAVPQSVGHVDVLHEIGRGGMGAVYLGRDRMLSRDVAVKFLLNVSAGEDDPRFEEFLQGARKAASLRHPNLVTVHQASLENNVPCLIMEYIDGPTLRDLLRLHGRLPLPTAIRVAFDIAGAIAALHEAGTIHRDLKPGNVLFDRSGRLFVTDFGLACSRPRPTDATAPDARMARIAGTPAYMAPEMFAGQVSPRTDVYALGIMLYEMLAGSPPYVGDFEQVRTGHQALPLPTEPLTSAAVPTPVIELIERALHKNEIFRFKGARELHRALRQCGVEPATDAQLQHLAQLAEPRHEHRPAAAPSEGSSSYFDRLTRLATEKYVHRGDTPPEPPKPPWEGEEAPPPLTLVQRVTHCVLCVGCGGDLNGLPLEDECPDCGTPVRRSLAPAAAVPRNPDEPRSMHRATGTLRSVCIAFIVWLVSRELAAAAALLGPRWEQPVSSVVRVAPWLLHGGGLVLLLIGLLTLTKGQPRNRTGASPDPLRAATRGAGVLSAVVYWSKAGLGYMGLGSFVGLAGLISGASALTAAACGLAYLARRTAPLSDPGRIVRPGAPALALCGAALVMTVVDAMLRASDDQAVRAVLRMLLTTAELALACVLIWIAMLLAQARHTLRIALATMQVAESKA